MRLSEFAKFEREIMKKPGVIKRTYKKFVAVVGETAANLAKKFSAKRATGKATTKPRAKKAAAKPAHRKRKSAAA
jgi:hypothetical protein